MLNESRVESLDIRPSPRVLQVLGDIEMTPVMCLAELIDNSFDDFLDLVRDSGDGGVGTLRVNVTLPGRNDAPQSAEIIVSDTGRGMDVETLNNAVRAGWTGNDPFSNLGLFGMGFNIASARLGNRTRVMTTRAGDDEWVGVDIDLRRLSSQEDFVVPVVREGKDDPALHGTRITVTQLNPGNYESLITQGKRLRDTLGDIYAPLLERTEFDLKVNAISVAPHRHCTWDESRSVSFGSGANAEEISAVIRFDELLPDQVACRTCRQWQDPGWNDCQTCGSTDLITRTRRVHGWLGIQRYLDTEHYGIDFIRNGRKILLRDKSLFEWTDPNRPGSRQIDYPVELPSNQGRIVGEVHIDYVPVNYQKNAFISDSHEWLAVRKMLRGDNGPLRLNYRREAGFDGYASGPLARVHRAFQNNRPGKRYLIPGNGKQAIHDKAREWGRKFHEGDPAFRDDARWWEAADLHDRIADQDLTISELPDQEDVSTDVITDIFGPIDPPQPAPTADDGGEVSDEELPDDSTDDAAEDTAETFVQRVERYHLEYPVMPDLEGQLGLPDAVGTLDVTVHLVEGERVLDLDNQPVPVLAHLAARSTVWAFVDAQHPLFAEYDTSIVDIVLAEMAEIFRVAFESELSPSSIIARLKADKLSDRRLESNRVAGNAENLLDDVRARMAASLAEQDEPERSWNALTDAEREATETRAAADGRVVAGVVSDGSFVHYVPALALPRIVTDWPEAFLDGRVFDPMYLGIAEGNQQGRWLSLARIAGYLYDLGVLVDRPVKLRGDSLRRAALSLELLARELSDPSGGS
jgi:hypothetical protein